MSRENSYSAIVIKKQAYGEADEIITLYTRQAGKLRVLCKAAKLPSSRLGPALQTFFLVNVRLTQSAALPKVIGVQTDKAFPGLQQDTETAAYAFVAAEIIMRATPDEQKNEELFDLFVNFLGHLDQQELGKEKAFLSLVKFKINALEALGLGVSQPHNLAGFAQAKNINALFDQLISLKQNTFHNLPKTNFDVAALDRFISGFLVYQLEREIKSERFIKQSESVV